LVYQGRAKRIAREVLKLLAPVVVPGILAKYQKLQQKIGYKLKFKNLPEDWINGYAMVDMTKTWTNYGLSIKGLNYFTLGNIKNGISTRFIPGGKMYQAWFGGYIFTDTSPINWTPENYLKVAEADQKKWLLYFGKSDPAMDFGELKKVKRLTNSGKQAELFSWSGTTNSDVGKRSNRLYNRAIMDGMAYIMNKNTPGLNLKGSNFIPKLPIGKSYEELTIYGFIVIIDLTPNTKAMLYVCMSENSDDNVRYMEDLITKHIDWVKI
jgi:hypothetical protein